MLLLQMLLQGLNIVELKPWVALVYHALCHPELCASGSDLRRLVVDILVFRVHGELLLESGLAEVLKGEAGSLRYQELLTFSFANGTLLVLQDETQSQDARVTHVLVVALAQCELSLFIETQNAMFLIREINLGDITDASGQLYRLLIGHFPILYHTILINYNVLDYIT